MKRTGFFAAALIAVFAVGRPFAQNGGGTGGGEAGLPGDFTIRETAFSTRMSMGFNYDLLRSMTGVSFKYPVGYLGFNVPLSLSAGLGDFLDDETMDDIFSNGKIFKAGGDFRPTAAAEQKANYTVRVDVPMLAGVGTFAYTQNFFMNLSTDLGGVIDPRPRSLELIDGADGFLTVGGAIRLPLSFNMGWETMTLGYAYRVKNYEDLVFALNMHRHLFSANIRMKADIDILGYVNVTAGKINFGEELIDFSSDRSNGFAQGRFSAEAWTPSIGVKWKRFSLNSRFGLNTRARGSASGGFVIPRVVDLETGDLLLADKIDEITAKIDSGSLDLGGIIPKELDTIFYEVKDSFRWRMPQGHTLSFDIIPQKLSVSYTKIFGEVAVEMDVKRTKRVVSDRSDASEAEPDDTIWYDKDVKVDVGVAVDHILAFSVTYPSFFANVGVGGFDIRSNEKHVLRDNKSLKSLRVGDVVMLLPIINGGFNLGTKLQLRVEADILPLPALRSGVNYYF